MDAMTRNARRQRVEQWLRNPKNLPVIPEVIQNALSLLDSNASSVSQVAEVIRRDEAISAKLLKLVNSAFYGIPRTITTISQAVAMLGFGQTRMMLIGMATMGIGRNGGPPMDSSREMIWQHSIHCARWTRAIAGRTRYAALEEACLAGLLHDIGKVTLATASPSSFAEALHLAHLKRIASNEAERDVVGMDHSEVGALMAERWNFPPLYQDCIAFHHHPWPPPLKGASAEPTKLRQLLAIVRVANSASRLLQDKPLGRGSSLRGTVNPRLDDQALDDHALELLVEEVAELTQQSGNHQDTQDKGSEDRRVTE